MIQQPTPSGRSEPHQGPDDPPADARTGGSPDSTASSPADGLLALCHHLGLDCTAPQAHALQQFLTLLQRWNRTYNLTAVRDPAAMRTQHLADCLAVVPALQRLGRHQGRALDVGSGGGLPGVVLAILLPGLDVTCVDTVGKKVAFVRQAGGTLGLPNLHAAHARVQDLRATPFDLVTSRAFASLPDFTQWTAAHLKPGGCWLAMKGKLPTEEIAALPPQTEVFHVEHLQVPGLDAERCLVWLRPRGNAQAGTPPIPGPTADTLPPGVPALLVNPPATGLTRPKPKPPAP